MIVKQKREHRKEERLKTIKAGRIIFYRDNCVVKCLVRDLSKNGAKLQTEIAIDCPDNFKLVLHEGPTFNCFVAWRKANLIGVRFANQ